MTVNVFDKANAAKRLKENPDFQEIVRWIEADIFEAFKSVEIGNMEKLATVHNLSHGFKTLNSRIDKYIETAAFESSKDEDR